MVRDDSEEGGEGAGDGAGDTPDIHPSLQPTALDILSTDTANTPKNCGQTHFTGREECLLDHCHCDRGPLTKAHSAEVRWEQGK